MEAGALVQDDPISEAPAASRQNPILREYFRAYFASVHSRDWTSVPEPMVEKFIDVRIDDYLKGLRKSVDQLRVHADELRTAQASMPHGSDAGDVAQRLLLKRALSSVQEDCSRLRRMLARVLTDLRSKNEFAISVSRDDPSFEREVGSILNSIDKAVGRIEDYFFLSQPTVHIGGLKNENMLIYLWQAQRMASAVEAAM